MKRLWVFLNLIILYPSLWLSRLHLLRSDEALKLDLLRVWSGTFLRMMRLKPSLYNQNHIPLEDGYVFIVEHKSSLDLLALAQVLPLDFALIQDARDPIFLIKPILATLKPLRVDTHTVDFTSNDDTLNTQLRAHKNLLLFSTTLSQKELNPSFFSWIKAQGLTLIPISNDLKRDVYQWRLQDWGFHVGLPIHQEEHESLSSEALQRQVHDAFKSSALVELV